MAVWSQPYLTNIRSSFGRMDAEFYRPKSLEAFSRVTAANHERLGQLVADGYRVVYENTKILGLDQITYVSARFLQATNLGRDGLSIELDSLGYVAERDWLRYPKGRIKAGELLIEVKGQAEKVTIVPNDFPERTLVSGSLFKLTTKADRVSPWYLFVFLASQYGKLLRDRLKTNTLIGFVSKPQLYSIPVFLPDPNDEREVSLQTQESIRLHTLSRELYQQAQKLLESELGLDKLLFQKPVGYVAQFSEVLNGRRIDADYFRSSFRQIDGHLDNYSTTQLHTLVDVVKGIEVGSSAYQAKGHPFLRVSNIKERGIEVGPSDKYISPEIYDALQSYRPQIGELLLTKDGSPGVATVVDQECNGIISGGVVRLKPKTDNIPLEYLALVINSRACRMQVERECSGALILHWKPALIRKLRVPVLPHRTMDKIAALVTESKQARRKSDELLSQAKTRVEQLIEEAIQL